ncbi:MAG: alpha/beta fold hydrolase [Aestuariivita sp.]|nr:alpha/beta fold hydrolase [Aestuariivita sp.]
MLNLIEFGTPTTLPALVIAHGLFGSARNWGSIAKRLSDERQVIAVDLRNHGKSPWSESHTYEDMAEDLCEVISARWKQVDLVGHSMGGKAVMMFALLHSHFVRKMIVADISPVNYNHNQIEYIQAMRAVDLSRVNTRSDAARQLAKSGIETPLQHFFCQSLNVADKIWHFNLDALEQNMQSIMSFPPTCATHSGSVLFLSGSESNYIRPEHRTEIKRLFPYAQFAKLPCTGHWIHADNPQGTEVNIRAFFAV